MNKMKRKWIEKEKWMKKMNIEWINWLAKEKWMKNKKNGWIKWLNNE